jgi:2-methylisocitrate lyase-like PEP mutase family enzyme
LGPDQQQKGKTFRALHQGDPFVIPNPWDEGSARELEALGFQALATTSFGFALTLGRRDGELTLDQMAEHARTIASSTTLPLSVDLENGYGERPDDAAAAIARAAEAGAVGGSIEDWDPAGRIYDLDLAAERVRAAAETARGLGFPFVLTARAENHSRNNPDLEDTITRLRAYEEAGADVLYAPSLDTVEKIRAVCDAISKPVNVLALPHLTVDAIVDAGAQRVSTGPSLADVAYGAMVVAAKSLLDGGDLSPLMPQAGLRQWRHVRTRAK